MSRMRIIEEVFNNAADLPASERSSYLDGACAADPGLRTEVEALLSQLNADVGGAIASAAALVDLPDAAPTAIGPFRIVRVLGEGGMGRVYEAEQDAPRRTVALKVIRPGLMSRSVLRRFAHEAEVLGQLKHPGIAQVYQAGALAGPEPGALPTPYFAMELVRGPNIAEFVKAHALTHQETLALLARVCDGVQHAHQRGIIHRDLKPGNILVEVTPEGPQPKILDFGISRLTSESQTSATMQTQAGQILGTLTYMSPEQVEADDAGVDTRSDVYSLGVMAYELLAGRVPIDVSGTTIVEAARRIREQEPTSLGSVSSKLRGDVETIVRKAMAKERERRYASAAELGADIRRSLAHEPISARPATTWYQLNRFARRNKPLVGGAALALAAVIVGGSAAAWQAIVATRERNAAREAERRATSLKDFLAKDVFGAAGSSGKGPAMPAGELLASAGERLEERFKGDPELRLEGERLMFSLQSEMGQPARAAEHARTCVRMSIDLYGPDDRRTVRSELDLAEMLLDAEATDEVEPMVKNLLERVRREYGRESGEDLRAGTLMGMLHIQRSRPGEAQAILEETHRTHVGHFERSPTGAFRLLAALTSVSATRDQPEAQLRWARELLEYSTTRLSRTRTAVSSAYQALAQALMNNNRFDEAEPMMRQALEHDRAFLMPDDPDLVRSLGQYGIILARMNRVEDAERVFVEVSQLTTKRLGPAAWESFVMRRRLLTLYMRAGLDDRAERWLRDEEALQQSLRPGDHQATLEPLRHLAQLHLMRGRVEPARAILADLKPRVDKAYAAGPGPDSKHFLAAMDITMGMLERRLGRGDVKRTRQARELIARGLDVNIKDWSSSYPEIARLAQKELDEIDGVKPLDSP